MHTDLMCASRAQAHAQQIGMRESRDECGVRDGVSPPLCDGHALAFFGMTRDWRFDVDGTLAEVAPDQRRMHALHLAPLERAGAPPVRHVALPRDEQTGRITF